MRNSEGEDFRTLIRTYASEYGPGQVKEIPLDEEIVASIDNHRMAAIVQGVLAENKSLKYRVDLLKNQFKKLQQFPSVPVVVSDRAWVESQLALPEPQSLPLTTRSSAFEERECAAVRMFLDNLSSLEEVIPDPAGTGALLHARHGWEVAPPGFLQALRKITLVPQEDV